MAYTRKRRFRKRRFSKRNQNKKRGTKRRRYYGGQVGVDTNPNDFNDEEKVLERQMRLLA